MALIHRLATALCLAHGLGCADLPLETGEIIEVATADDAAACVAPADGRAIVPFRISPHAWAPAQVGVALELVASSGHWLEGAASSPKATLTKDTVPDEAFEALWVAGTDSAELVVAARAGERQATRRFTLCDAPVGPVEIVPSPALLVAGEDNQVTISVIAHGVGNGKVSDATTVACWAALATLEGAADCQSSLHAPFYPSSRPVDEHGAASFVAVLSPESGPTLPVCCRVEGPTSDVSAIAFIDIAVVSP